MAGLVFSADFKVNGVYTAWGQSQHNFSFGKAKYNDNYVVQMLRFKVQAAVNEHLRAVTRFDMAQGWWGVDNALKSKLRTGTAGGSALFDFKDTNFLFHVDQAYLEFDLPEKPLTFRVGRMWYGLGNKIMVDNNYDGVQLDVKGVLGKKISLSWAKVSEGVDGISDEKRSNQMGEASMMAVMPIYLPLILIMKPKDLITMFMVFSTKMPVLPIPMLTFPITCNFLKPVFLHKSLN